MIILSTRILVTKNGLFLCLANTLPSSIPFPISSRALTRYIKLLGLVRKHAKNNATIGDIFAEFVSKQPEKACLIFEGRTWTFREVREPSRAVRACGVDNCFLSSRDR